MNAGEKQLDAWSGDFGKRYALRNQITPVAVEQRRLAFSHIFDYFEEGDEPSSILEIGCNIGINLNALSKVTNAELHAIEPNHAALEILAESGLLPENRVQSGSIQAIPFGNGEMDLVLTSGVLIHIPDDALESALSELYRVSRRYILMLEYFAPSPETVPYHGHDDFLFKRDYGSILLDNFPDLQHIANGFFWKRTSGLDNLNWWLLRK